MTHDQQTPTTLHEIDQALREVWDKAKLVPDGGVLTVTLTNTRFTREGRKLFGLPIEPRRSRGFRRHIRRMKQKASST